VYNLGNALATEEFAMTLLEQIQQQIKQLPPEKQSEVLDFVTFLKERPLKAQMSTASANQGRRIKKSLEQLAKLKVFSDITDPVDWQRKTRQDRPLPGRGV
jgi:hypothetical protein